MTTSIHRNRMQGLFLQDFFNFQEFWYGGLMLWNIPFVMFFTQTVELQKHFRIFHPAGSSMVRTKVDHNFRRNSKLNTRLNNSMWMLSLCSKRLEIPNYYLIKTINQARFTLGPVRGTRPQFWVRPRNFFAEYVLHVGAGDTGSQTGLLG
jgi:hypothetical protein